MSDPANSLRGPLAGWTVPRPSPPGPVGTCFSQAQQATVRKGRSKNGSVEAGFDFILKRDVASFG